MRGLAMLDIAAVLLVTIAGTAFAARVWRRNVEYRAHIDRRLKHPYSVA